MSKIVVIAATTEGGLTTVASKAKATLIDGTSREFSALQFYPSADFEDIGDIDTDNSGWVALATKNAS